MSDELTPYDPPALLTQRREALLEFEALLKHHPQAVVGDSELFPLVHRFAPGIYLREIFLKAGSLVSGKIHREAHPVFLMQGAIQVFTEASGLTELHAPLVFIAPAGVKRAALVLEDTVWCTVHHNPSNTQDLAALEAEIIVPSFEAFDAWKALQSG